MHRKSIVIPPADFLKSYMPVVDQPRPRRTSSILQDIPVSSGQEVKMYKPLVDALNGSGICPDFEFVAISTRGDPSDESNEAVDIGLFPNDCVPVGEEVNGKIMSLPTDWLTIEICIECKMQENADDPFDETKPHNEPTTEDRKGSLGQIFSYAEFILKRQQRTCVFMVLLLGSCCRLVRFDRSGAIATHKFDYKKNGSNLIEFIWRYARSSAATRGHDTSAQRIDPSSPLGKLMEARAQKDKDPSNPTDYVRQMFEDSLADKRWGWWKLRVDCEGGARYFLVGKPNFQAPGVAGRGTKGYVAVDVNDIDGPFYYLKDAWRLISPIIANKEGETLSYLNSKGVDCVPTLECHGDVGSPTKQLTKTDALWDELHKGKEEEVRPVKKHAHYRIVVREVGQPLSTFTRGRQLVYVLWCCVYAHEQAYKAGVMHRDISSGNLLRYYDAKNKEWCGLLTDWEMSKRAGTTSPEGPQLDRTASGTWQFLSADVLDSHKKEITIQHELESFFHVLLYFTIRFLPHNIPKAANFMREYFDGVNTAGGEYGCGVCKYYVVTSGEVRISLADDGPKTKISRSILVVTWSLDDLSPDCEEPKAHPVNKIIGTILQWLQAHYAILTTSIRNRRDNAQSAAREPTPMAEEEEYTFGGEESPSGPAEPEPIPAGVQRGKPIQLPIEITAPIAKKLETHERFLTLLRDVITMQKWPASDKTPDQLLKEGYKAGAEPLASPTKNAPRQESVQASPTGEGSSRKRPAEAIDQLVAQPRLKRSKSNPRIATRRSSRKRS